MKEPGGKSMKIKKRSTIYVDEKVFWDFKKKCYEKNTNISHQLEEFMKDWLKK